MLAELCTEKPTVSQTALVEQGARLSLLADMAWSETVRTGGVTKNDGINPAYEGYLRAIKELRTVLATLFPEDMTLPEERVRVIFELPAALPTDIYAKVIEHDAPNS
jgi:hypothetical protein